jgi:hypothetical protein
MSASIGVDLGHAFWMFTIGTLNYQHERGETMKVREVVRKIADVPAGNFELRVELQLMRRDGDIFAIPMVIKSQPGLEISVELERGNDEDRAIESRQYQ